MAHYIDKAALVVEIERRIEAHIATQTIALLGEVIKKRRSKL